MSANEQSPEQSGLRAWLGRVLTRVLDGKPPPEPVQPPLPDEPGPSGIPPGPMRIERRG